MTKRILNEQFSITCRSRGETAAARECLRNLGYEIFHGFAEDPVRLLEDCTVVYDGEDISRGGKRELHFNTLQDCLVFHYDTQTAKEKRIAELKAEIAALEAE